MDTTEDSRGRKPRRARGGESHAAPIPEVDESVRREARAVGLLAVMFAAGISAQALYALGLLIGLSPWTAWMLPGAMDLYAFESTRVASRVPAKHPSRAWAVWNARLALSFTVAGNALFHALHLESGHQGWTTTDIALTAVSAVPPIIVERFLHLQTKINVGVGVNTSGSATGIGNRPAVTGNTPANRQAAEETGKQQPTGNGRATDNPPAANDPADRQPSADKVPAAVKPETRQPAPSRRAVDGQPSTDTWVEIGKPVYDGLRAELGKRPGETVFHNTLAAHVAQLIADGALVGENKDEKPDAYADPSLSTAKRIRGEIEARFPGIIFGHHATDQHGDVTEEVA